MLITIHWHMNLNSVLKNAFIPACHCSQRIPHLTYSTTSAIMSPLPSFHPNNGRSNPPACLPTTILHQNGDLYASSYERRYQVDHVSLASVCPYFSCGELEESMDATCLDLPVVLFCERPDTVDVFLRFLVNTSYVLM